MNNEDKFRIKFLEALQDVVDEELTKLYKPQRKLGYNAEARSIVKELWGDFLKVVESPLDQCIGVKGDMGTIHLKTVSDLLAKRGWTIEAVSIDKKMFHIHRVNPL